MSTKSLQNGAKRHQIAAERSKMTPNRCITQQNGPKVTQNVAKWHQIVSEHSFSREWAPNRCRTQQNCTKLMQNAAKRHQINAERSKTAANRCRTLILWRMNSFSWEWAHSLENELIIWRMSPQINAERTDLTQNRRDFVCSPNSACT